MIIEAIVSFLILCIVYALDELFLIDQENFNRLTIYKDWKVHFMINPIIGIIPGIFLHSLALMIIGYLMFGVIEDLFYQIIKRLKGVPFNWADYAPLS